MKTERQRAGVETSVALAVSDPESATANAALQLKGEEKMKRPSKKQVEQSVENWNAMYPVGTSVNLTNDMGETEETKTRSEAWVLGGHTAVVLVEGRSGGYLLDRIKPILQ